jgi:hypothetical protein
LEIGGEKFVEHLHAGSSFHGTNGGADVVEEVTTRKTLKRHRDGGWEPLAIDHQRKRRLPAEQTGILTKEPDHRPQER